MNDYEVLGLKEGADENQIKRAYFKLVRQFSPEKDPERFQQIRQAYENLKEGRKGEALALVIPDERFAGEMFRQIKDLYGRRNFKGAIETAEEAIRYYGEWTGYLYYLSRIQLENGNTGKAVKGFEKLVEREPDNVHFVKKLALAYMERGYGKKAYSAFAKAYGLGCREIDFLNDYAMICRDRKDYARSADMLSELIELGSTDCKKNMMYLINASAGLFQMCLTAGNGNLDQARETIYRCLDSSAPYMPEYEEELQDMAAAILLVLKGAGQAVGADRARIRMKLERGLGRAKADTVMDSAEKAADLKLIMEDDRLSEPWKTWRELLSIKNQTGFSDEETRRYILLDCKLCVLEEWPGIRGEVEIIRECYPLFYDCVREFIETLERAGNTEYLRRKMLKDFERLARYMPVSMYEEKYGSVGERVGFEDLERTVFGDLERDDERAYQEPYVRSQPKIGRNDPCPCGSGKKYKKCCGK